MSDTAPPFVIRHNEAELRFDTMVDGHLCVADYRLSDGVMHMTHTLVPPELEGRGIAGALVRVAFAHARTHSLKIDPVCSYVRVYMQRHPETQDLHA